MSDAHLRQWSRALSVAATLAIGLAALMSPAATPVAEAASVDLEMHATAEATFHLGAPGIRHRMIVDVHGATAAPGQAVVAATFPSGVRPNPNDIQATNTHTTWSCTALTSAVICKNTSPFVPNTGGVYFQVGLLVSGPIDATVVSSVDPANNVPESNEGNNVGTATYHFVK